MIETVNKGPNLFHLAGVVPVAGQPLEFNFPWHPSLNPINKDYLALQRAAYECAMAGCETIWVVCHMETQPLIRNVLGEWVTDPASLGRGFYQSDNVRRVPIYYVPVHPKDRQKRDSLGWSVLYGALSAYWISRKMSKWLTPDMYYACFPYGVYPVEFLKQERKKISSRKKFLLNYKGQTVKDGLPIGFTFDGEDFKNCRRSVREESTSLFDSEGNRLSIKERYSARNFSLDKVFECVNIEDVNKVEVPWYHDISTWKGYAGCIASDKKLTKPQELKYNEWNTIRSDWDRSEGEGSDDRNED